jgi:hypothetical protein
VTTSRAAGFGSRQAKRATCNRIDYYPPTALKEISRNHLQQYLASPNLQNALLLLAPVCRLVVMVFRHLVLAPVCHLLVVVVLRHLVLAPVCRLLVAVVRHMVLVTVRHILLAVVRHILLAVARHMLVVVVVRLPVHSPEVSIEPSSVDKPCCRWS